MPHLPQPASLQGQADRLLKAQTAVEVAAAEGGARGGGPGWHTGQIHGHSDSS